MSGMFEKQGKLKRRQLCLPSLSVNRKTVLYSKDGGPGMPGGTGVHPSGSNSSSHAKLLFIAWCWQEASGKKRRKYGCG